MTQVATTFFSHDKPNSQKLGRCELNLPPDLAAWESAALVGREFGAVARSPTILVVDLEATCEEAAQLQAVPVQLQADGRPYYVRLADIPHPWPGEFRAALRGSGCPAIAGEGECTYAWDWSDWLRGRFPWW